MYLRFRNTAKSQTVVLTVLAMAIGVACPAFASSIPIGNTAPTVDDDEYGVSAGQTLNVGEPGVLANDEDADGDEMTATLDQDAANGTLDLNEDGSFSYTPNDSFTGQDTFTYTASDGAATSAAATVTITVAEATNIPKAVIEAVPTEGLAPLTVAFDGSKSTDPNGVAIVLYRWHFGRGLPRISVTPTATGIYPTSGSYTASLVVRNANGEISAPTYTTIRVGDGVVGDAALFLKTGSFKINWKKHDSGTNADTFKISGYVNPNDFPDDVSTMEMDVRVNGNPIAPLQNPKSSRAATEPTFTTKLKSTNGSFSFSGKNMDLRGLLGLQNESDERDYRVKVEIGFPNQTLATQSYKGVFDWEYKSTEGKTAPAKYKYKNNAAYTGYFLSTSTKATEQSDGSFAITSKGNILGDLSTPVVPTGDIMIAVGSGATPSAGANFTLPFAALSTKGANESSSYTYSKKLQEVTELKKFQINNAKKSFSLTTTGLADTGIPATGDAAVVHDLSIWFMIPTASGTNIFRINVELKRKSSTSKSWKR